MLDIYGLFKVDTVYAMTAVLVVALIAVILSIVSICKSSSLKKKYNGMMEGSDGKNIEKLIKENLDDIKKLKSASVKQTNAIKDIYEKLEGTFQKIGIVKYDAFHEMGGKLSFALCVLDKCDNGCLVNVMHSNTGCFAYVKEIIGGKSYLELGADEQKALDQAIAGGMGDIELGQEINDLVSKDKM
ncbi:MAG: DUF4446 family protein [Lachnospira sp.]